MVLLRLKRWQAALAARASARSSSSSRRLYCGYSELSLAALLPVPPVAPAEPRSDVAPRLDALENAGCSVRGGLLQRRLTLRADDGSVASVLLQVSGGCDRGDTPGQSERRLLSGMP